MEGEDNLWLLLGVRNRNSVVDNWYKSLGLEN